MLGMNDPIGTRMSYFDRHYSVIGVIEDIIPNPRWRIDEPLVVFQMPQRYRYIFLKVSPQDISRVLGPVREIFERINPAFPFEYDFMDEEFDIQFNFVRRTRSLIVASALLAIYISCLGLFSVWLYSMPSREPKRSESERSSGPPYHGSCFCCRKT